MENQIPKKAAEIQSGAKIQAIVPRTIEEAFRMSEAIFMAGMYPESYGVDAQGNSTRGRGHADPKATVSRIMIGIQKAMEVGLAPITGLSTIYIVNNRPTIYGDGVPALLYGSGKIEYIKESTSGVYPNEDFTAICEIKRKDSDEPIIREFSMADAKKANLIGKAGPWSLYPKRQLQMRARGFAARDGAPDILSGLGVYEEVIDIPEPRKDVIITSLDDDAPAQIENAQEVPLELEEPAKEYINATETACATCGGTGVLVEIETDLTGQSVESKGPCPACSNKG